MTDSNIEKEIKEEIERINTINDVAKLADEFRGFGKLLTEKGEPARAAFRDAQGYELLTRHRSVCPVLDKHPDEAHGTELLLLLGVFRLCYGAGSIAEEEHDQQPGKVTQTGSRDNRVRSLQIRGVAEYALHVASDSRYAEADDAKDDPEKSLRVAGLRLLERLTEDGSICKLLCNRMNFVTDDGLYKNEFSNNQISTVCSLACLCRPTTEAAPVRDACARVLANLACCPRLQRRLCDIQRPPPKKPNRADDAMPDDSEAIAKMQKEVANAAAKIANPVIAMDSLVKEAALHLTVGVSGDFVTSLVRLSGLSAFRASARRCPELLRSLIQLICREDQPDLSDKAARILAMSLVEPPDVKEQVGQLDNLELPESGRPDVANRLRIVRCAKQLSSANVDQLLRELVDCDLHPCEQLFTQIYKSAYSSDLNSDGSPNFKKLMNSLRQPEWADSPLLLFSGALLALTRAASDPAAAGDVANFLKDGGFDLLTKHRALPTAMQVMKHADHQDDLHRERSILLVSAYRLGCAMNKAEGDFGRAHSVRFLQMPIVLDLSVKYLKEPVAMRESALEILTAISQRPEVCKLMCNKLNLLPYLHLLQAQGDSAVKLLIQLLDCPRLKTRLYDFRHSVPPVNALDLRNLFKWLRNEVGAGSQLFSTLGDLINLFDRAEDMSVD